MFIVFIDTDKEKVMEEEVITTSFVKRLVKEIEELREINEQHRKINGELREELEKLKEEKKC